MSDFGFFGGDELNLTVHNRDGSIIQGEITVAGGQAMLLGSYHSFAIYPTCFVVIKQQNLHAGTYITRRNARGDLAKDSLNKILVQVVNYDSL